MIHNYGNSYEKWNIFVAWPYFWLKLGMVKPEIMSCETVLNLSTLHYVTVQYPLTWRHVIGLVRQLLKMETPDFISPTLWPPIQPGFKSGRLQSLVSNTGGGLQEVDQGHWRTACTWRISERTRRGAYSCIVNFGRITSTMNFSHTIIEIYRRRCT